MKLSGTTLAALSALCVCTGLALVRRLPRSARERGLFTMGAAGFALFVVIEVGYQALGTVELGALSDTPGSLALSAGLLIIGLLCGMVGLAWIETRRGQPGAYDPRPLDVAMMLAAGVGLYSFAKGLSVGQSMATSLRRAPACSSCSAWRCRASSPAPSSPRPSSDSRCLPGRLLLLAAIVAGPSVGGIIVGTSWVGPGLELLVLSLAAGTLVYVLRELLRGRLEDVSAVGAMWGLAVGLLLALAAELLVELGRQS